MVTDARATATAPDARQPETGRQKSTAPVLLITIDTEEEFDWHRSPYEQTPTVSHMPELPRLQDVFDAEGARATYVCDYPILTDNASIDVLQEFRRRGTCEVGTHLHPWVNPPVKEAPRPAHTYLSNLPLDLQQEKLEYLTAAYREAFGDAPRSFKAGRYGIDWRLGPFLTSCGYVVDGSAVAYTDFGSDGGPDFRDITPWRLRWPGEHELSGAPLEVPCSVAYTRGPFAWSHWLHNKLSMSALRRLRLVGVLWHTRLLRKIFLSPEVHALPDLLAALRALHRAGSPVYHLSLHSPSIVPGHTPYIRTEAERDQLLVTLQTLIRYARRELGATCQTLTEFALAQTEPQR